MLSRRPILVMEMPEQLGACEAVTLKHDLEPLLECEEPRIVFDCRELRSIDNAGIEILWECFEEAVKHDGDLKLAALSEALSSELAATQICRASEVFATSHEAVRSFNALPALGAPHACPSYSGVAPNALLKKAS